MAGWDVVLAADVNNDACATYSLNFAGANVWCTDLAEVSTSNLLKKAGLAGETIDLIVGGPPCQGFSTAGSRDWTDPRNRLLRQFVEIVTSVKPTWFIMENVEGLLTAKQGYFFIEAVMRLLAAGYWIRAEKVYMENYGLPQRRKRVFVVGNLEQKEFLFPPANFSDVSQENPFAQLSLFTVSKGLSLLDAISDLPSVTSSGEVWYQTEPQNIYQAMLRRTDRKPVTLHSIQKLNDENIYRVKLLKQGQTMRDLPEALWHPSFARRAYRRVMDGTPTEKRGGAPSGLKRLKADEPSLTITSAAAREFIHPCQDRPLSIRECARIQSFPDWFEFAGSRTSIVTQIGNAIPPLFMKILATHINEVATWRRKADTHGLWNGINATKADAKSPVLDSMLQQLEQKTKLFHTPYLNRSQRKMNTLSNIQKILINTSRSSGGKLSVYLEDNTLLRICAVVAADIGRVDLVEDFVSQTEVSNGYYGIDLNWFEQPVNHVNFENRFIELAREISDFDASFYMLCELHKKRVKFNLILENQPLPEIEQVVPRALLEYGTRPSDALASWIIWRKWLYDIDNRAAQETGYLYEPILAAALGGEPKSGKQSPIKRKKDKSKYRQVDCLVDKRAYEFKMRVTIAASGQGRFKQELEFPEDCQESGYIPVLLILDSTPSEKQDLLIKAFREHGGEAYVGDYAWQHIREQAGITISTFLDKYVKTPLEEVDNAYSTSSLLPIILSKSGESLNISIGNFSFEIDREKALPEFQEALGDTGEDEEISEDNVG